MRTAVFIPTRIKSTRLKNKILLDLAGEKIFTHCLRSAKKINVDKYVVLCPEEDEKLIRDLSESENYEVVTGPIDSVLKRFIKGIEKYNIDFIVRITHDKTIISEKHQNNMLEQAILLNNPDCVVGCVINPVRYTVGEVYNSKTLLRSINNEFITNQQKIDLWDYFKVYSHLISVEENLMKYDCKLTIDNNEEYLLFKKMFEELYKERPITIEEACNYIQKKNKR